jgi:hypothetical protein
VEENFFEDDSLDASNSSDSEEEEEGPETPPARDHMYDRYFGGQTWKSRAEKLDQPSSPSHRHSSEQSPSSPRKMRAFGGPSASADMLSPVVQVRHDFDALVLNHQSVHLAKEWELGGWEFIPTKTFDDYQGDVDGRSTSPEDQKEGSENANTFESATPHFRQGNKIPNVYCIDTCLILTSSSCVTGLPQSRFIVTSARKGPNLDKVSRRAANIDFQAEERGVHGGEYSVRPNMQESMTFLQKLFSHQQGGGTTFPTLQSPPDSPLCKFLLAIPCHPLLRKC